MHLPIPPSIPTIAQLIQQILDFDPRQAARKSNPALCVTGVIEWVLVDGEPIHLERIQGRFGGGYARVSDAKQRTHSDTARAASKRKRQHYKTEGQSEAEQVERLIRYFVAARQAFRVYSDAAVSGEYPNNRPDLIARMHKRKAHRYRANFERVLLDPVSLQQWTPAQVTALRQYLKQRTQAIEQGYASERPDEDTGLSPNTAPVAPSGAAAPLSEAAVRRARRGHGGQAYHRQGYSSLLSDVEGNHLHTVITIEGSRICRDPELHMDFLQVCAEHTTRLVGLMRDFLDMDVNEPMEKAVVYMMSSVDAQRLSEISRHCFRGLVHSLKCGIANGNLPFWLARDKETGEVVAISPLVEVVQEIVQRSLCGQGISSIHADLRSAGVQIERKPISRHQINTVLSTPAIIGKQSFFGLEWDTLPRVVEDVIYEEMQRARTQRREAMDAKGGVHDPRRWAVHELTHVMRCWCGRLLRRRYQTEAASGKRHYYWDCAATREGRPHARLQAERLEAFVFDLCRHNPRILCGAFAAANGAAGAQQQAQYQLLQTQLHTTEAAFTAKQACARQEAEAKALALHVQPTSPHFGTIVDGLVADALQSDRADLQTLREEVGRLSQDVAQARQTEALQRSLGQAQEWESLDVPTRNRLVGSVFSRIVVHMPQEGVEAEAGVAAEGRLELYLTGLDTPLPPICLRRGPQRTLLLPTVEEWIATMFAL